MTRSPAPISPKVALTIAGSDSGGGAGIQADIKTIEACGVFATSVITAVTAQNTQGVNSSYILPINEIESQFDAVSDDFSVDGMKTGMLGTEPVIRFVTEKFRNQSEPTVVDPVMVAATGDRLLERAAETAYEELIGTATLVTPNADEAAVLTGIEAIDEASATDVGEALLDMGAAGALVKGGHIPGDIVRDVLVTKDSVKVFEHERIETDNTHGSGCTLASAITARLALGDDLSMAVDTAVTYLQQCVRYGLDVGKGPGSVHHMVGLRNRADREPTAETVESIVAELVAIDVSPLVPEVGMNVVGSTEFGERVEDTAAVEGRITRTLTGVKPNRGIRFGASSHVARFLLAAREYDPSLRYSINCRFNADIEDALSVLDGEVSEFVRSAEPVSIKEQEGSTMQWGARQAFDAVTHTPVAVIDRGEVGKEAIVKILAVTPLDLINRVRSVLDQLA